MLLILIGIYVAICDLSDKDLGPRRAFRLCPNTKRLCLSCFLLKDGKKLAHLFWLLNSGASSIDYMDDVGQTLLNWAAAFGTQEMVEFLCQKGADVNKGQRSSSLHYAACFGRPQIAQVLLRFGANPDLRDEDGKTPLDKAREGNNEGHREVANILQVWPLTFFFASPQKLICFEGK